MTICKLCGSSDIVYWDNIEMCTTFDWGYYCEGCKKYLDPYSDIETKEDLIPESPN